MPDGSIRCTAEGEDEMMAAVNKAFEKSGIKIPATNEAGQDLGQEVTAVDEEGNLTAWIVAPRLAGKRLFYVAVRRTRRARWTGSSVKPFCSISTVCWWIRHAQSNGCGGRGPSAWCPRRRR